MVGLFRLGRNFLVLHMACLYVEQATSRRRHGSWGRAPRGGVRVAGRRRYGWRVTSKCCRCWYWAIQPLFPFYFFVYMLFSISVCWNKGDCIPLYVVSLFYVSWLVGILFAGMNSKEIPSICGGFRPLKDMWYC